MAARKSQDLARPRSSSSFMKYQAWRMHFHNAILRQSPSVRRKKERERVATMQHSLDISWYRPRVFQLAGALCKLWISRCSLRDPKSFAPRCIFLHAHSLIVDRTFATVFFSRSHSAVCVRLRTSRNKFRARWLRVIRENGIPRGNFVEWKFWIEFALVNRCWKFARAVCKVLQKLCYLDDIPSNSFFGVFLKLLYFSTCTQGGKLRCMFELRTFHIIFSNTLRTSEITIRISFLDL